MSQRLTLGSLKYRPNGEPSRLSVLANVAPDDLRLVDWINGAEERLISYGRWWGTTQLLKICVTGSCNIVLPHEVAVIEAANLNGVPMNMGTSWYDFARPHLGYMSGCGSWAGNRCGCGCGCNTRFTLEERDPAASFATTTGTDKKIRVYATNTEDIGKKIIFQGYDENNNWVRTEIDGVVQDGEQVTLVNPNTYAETNTIWGPGAPVNVIKDPTDYHVLVYSRSTEDDSLVQLADYQPNELRPSYRVVRVPGFRHHSSCCESSTMMCIAKLQHIDAVNDTDFLLIQNAAAFQQAVLAEKAFENGDFNLGNAYFYGTKTTPNSGRGSLRAVSIGGAIPLLQSELRSQTGDQSVVQVQRAGVNLAGFL